VGDIIQFPTRAPDVEASSARQLGRAFLAAPTPHAHAVQFYEEDSYLVETVGHFLEAGLVAGDRLIVIATGEHRAAFAASLAGADAAIASGQLTMLDARETLEGFMRAGEPDPELFHAMLERLLIRVGSSAHRPTRIRAYGEMVDLLIRDGHPRAAIRLEELWNEAGKRHEFELLCAYVMGTFYKEGDGEHFLEVCRNHSHVLPTERFDQVKGPYARLREICLLQQRAKALESEVRYRKELELALREALRERSRTEDELRAAASREREARTAAEASDRFKDLFLGMLGNDLRSPLNTILTTARVMLMGGDLAADAAMRLGRVVSSGVQMQRMVEQLLDVARVRTGSGLPLRRAEHDVASLVTKIVGELRTNHPDREIALRADEGCRAVVDPDRVEQVVSNLVGNALRHGDEAHPIEVTVTVDEKTVAVAVHNFGPPIDPAVLPMLFDPFQRGHRQLGPADGLGLGLYISERIVTAHGGRIGVSSSAETGTRFEAIFVRGE
jgi:signal transduction histidine kinase